MIAIRNMSRTGHGSRLACNRKKLPSLVSDSGAAFLVVLSDCSLHCALRTASYVIVLRAVPAVPDPVRGEALCLRHAVCVACHTVFHCSSVLFLT